jgi:hypothetical protein
MPAMKRLGVLAIVPILLSIPTVRAEKGEAQGIQNNLADHFKIYLLRPDRRSAQDVVTVKELPGGGYSAEISYWRSLKSREPNEEACNAYRWLLLGRGSYGKGVAAAFEQFPALKQIFLRFVDVEIGTKVGTKRAEIVPTQKVVPYLRIGVSRATLASRKADWGAVKSDLDKGRCAEVAKRYFDTVWSDPAYLRPVQ